MVREISAGGVVVRRREEVWWMAGIQPAGVPAELVAKLGDIKYVYTRAWGDGERVFKIVSFYLMRYRSGRIDQITPEMRIEVARAYWVRLAGAAVRLAYKGEKQMAQRAMEYLETHPEL